MQRNIRWWDRILRFALGVLILAWFIAGGPWWTFFGVLPLATAAWGYCPLYAVLRLNSEDIR